MFKLCHGTHSTQGVRIFWTGNKSFRTKNKYGYFHSELIGHRNYFKKVRMIVNEHDHTRYWKLLCEIARTYYTCLKNCYLPTLNYQPLSKLVKTTVSHTWLQQHLSNCQSSKDIPSPSFWASKHVISKCSQEGNDTQNLEPEEASTEK
jgi:hypothetical protein